MAFLQFYWTTIRRPRNYIMISLAGLSLYFCLSWFLKPPDFIQVMPMNNDLVAQVNMNSLPPTLIDQPKQQVQITFPVDIPGIFDGLTPEFYKSQPGCKKCASIDFLVYATYSHLDFKKRMDLRKEFKNSFEESTTMLIFANGQPLNPDISNEIKKYADVVSCGMNSPAKESELDLFVFNWIQTCCGNLEMIAKVDGNIDGILEKVLRMGDSVIQGKTQLHNRIFCEKANEEQKTIITKDNYQPGLLQKYCSNRKGIYFSVLVVDKLLSAHKSK